jgi:type IV pilus assembly protein PilC
MQWFRSMHSKTPDARTLVRALGVGSSTPAARQTATSAKSSDCIQLNPAQFRVSRRGLASLLTMLNMLLCNGLSLQKSIEALSEDRACIKLRPMLRSLLARVAAGETLSRAMSSFTRVFTPTMVHHIALAEASGTLPDSLNRIVKNLEEALELRRKLIQKLSYPALVVLAGSGLVTFMLVSVVPQFETIYSESEVDLPWVTSVVTWLSRTLVRFIWFVPLLVVGLLLAWRAIRTNQRSSLRLDAGLMKLPLIGPFVQDASALEYLRSTLVLSEAGFVPLDALTQAAKSVPNREARRLLVQVASDVQRGQKISTALRPCEFLFPNAVLQLIAVAEQTGGLTQACHGACQLVRTRMESRMNALLGILEPLLTISLATCIGWIVLAIYMPMFRMFDVLDF